MSGKFNLRMDSIRVFFSKISSLFLIFKKGQGRPPHPNQLYACSKWMILYCSFRHITHYFFIFKVWLSETYLGPWHTSVVELFTKIVNSLKKWTILLKNRYRYLTCSEIRLGLSSYFLHQEKNLRLYQSLIYWFF